LLKVLFNIFLVYLVWQFIKLFFTVKKTQNKFQEKMDQFEKQNSNTKAERVNEQTKKEDLGGEYIDYEEVD
jgi:predicted Holliday junction resolvase-like endonuclease